MLSQDPKGLLAGQRKKRCSLAGMEQDRRKKM